MNFLLDTHTFLWWITDDAQLSSVAFDIIQDGNNVLFWSAASSWEIAIKHALGRLPLPEPPEIFIPKELKKNRIEALQINDLHAFYAGRLSSYHKDPFDRMLIAQARTESLVLLSCDSVFSQYDVVIKW
nr:type II toxin-antitoxin system VapC family toxin [uncultured Desulfobacter sp.]